MSITSSIPVNKNEEKKSQAYVVDIMLALIIREKCGAQGNYWSKIAQVEGTYKSHQVH